MNKFELYIEGEKMDLFTDESISVTQTLKNIRDIEKVFSDYSQNFNLPASSKRNQVVFKRYENISVVGGFDNRIRHEAKILLNGILFINGYIVLNNVKQKNGKATSYSIKFTGGLANVKKILKENKLNTLTALNTTMNAFSVTASTVASYLGLSRDYTNATNLPYGHDILYSLIVAHGNCYYDSGTIANDTNNLAYDPLKDNGVYFKSLKPSIRLNAIIRAIETMYGIEFSSDFFKDTTNDVFDKLFMHLNPTKGDIGAGDDVADEAYKQSSIAFSQWGAIDDTSTPANAYDITTGDTANYITINNTTSNFLFIDKVLKITITVTPGDDSLEYRIGWNNISTGASDSSQWSTGTSVLVFDNPAELIGKIAFVAQMEGDQTLDIDIDVALKGNDNDYTLKAKAISTVDVLFSLSNNLPDMTITTFLSGLFKMFNLIAYEDKDGIIVVKPFVDFIAAGKDIDITKYVDDSSLTIDTNSQYSGVSLKYAEVEDKNTIDAQGVSAKQYGSHVFSAVDTRAGVQDFELRLPFTLMSYRRLRDDNDGSLTDIMIGETIDKDSQPIKNKFPVLYYPQRIVGGSISLQDTISSSVEVTTYNVPSNTLSLFPDTSTSSIHFGATQASWDGSRKFVDTLYNVYYNSFISPLFNERQRMLIVEAYLPIGILSTFSLADRFVYKNNPYRINSITTNLQDGKSKIELITDTVIEVTPYSVGNVGNPPVITILGDNPKTANAGTIWVFDGATATDVEDGDLTGSITIVSPPINMNLPGTQFERYQVTDSDGNIVTETRVVEIVDTTAPVFCTIAYSSRTSTTVTTTFTCEDVGYGIGDVMFYYKKATDSEYILAKVINGEGLITFSGSTTFKGLTTGTSYNFKFVAYDRGGRNTTSNILTQSTS